MLGMVGVSAEWENLYGGGLVILWSDATKIEWHGSVNSSGKSGPALAGTENRLVM